MPLKSRDGFSVSISQTDRASPDWTTTMIRTNANKRQIAEWDGQLPETKRIVRFTTRLLFSPARFPRDPRKQLEELVFAVAADRPVGGHALETFVETFTVASVIKIAP